MTDPQAVARAALAVLVLAGCQTGTASMAQSQTANAGIAIERSLSVRAVRPITFDAGGRTVDAVSSGAVREAIVEVAGDPGRAYRVSLPASIEADEIGLIDGFTLRSETSGDITGTLTGRMNELGSDRLYLGGRLRTLPGLLITGVTAAIPVTIDYE